VPSYFSYAFLVSLELDDHFRILNINDLDGRVAGGLVVSEISRYHGYDTHSEATATRFPLGSTAMDLTTVPLPSVTCMDISALSLW
jgi:hypothetical protein